MNPKLDAKIRKEMPEFVDEVSALPHGELDSRLAQLAKDAEAVEDSKEADEELLAAQEKVAQMLAPYRDAKKMIRLKSKFIISIMKERSEK